MKVLLLLLAVVLASTAAADDGIKREIDTLHATANDLQALDTTRAVGDEITLLNTWLDEAENKKGRARKILDRCHLQADLIRKKLATAKLQAEAAKKETAAKDSADLVKKTAKALEDALIKKKAMELNAK